MLDKYICISEASLLFGVTTTTLRRWEKNKVFLPHHRTCGNHRRYKLNDILNKIGIKSNKIERKTICYARVSSHDQKQDLDRQANVLVDFCSKNKFKNILIIKDLGSGLNFKKKGLKNLINLILSGQVERIILTHKDRLLRFGSDLLINISKHFNTETIILNNKKQSFEQELSSDVLEIITVFSAKLYGSRSHKNKQKMDL